jgi:SAM-dependent methyltransferase
MAGSRASRSPAERLVLLANLAVTLCLVGLIWTIQVVHYPLFAEVGSAGFARYHALHSARITVLVGPLMVVEALLALGLLLEPGDTPPWLGQVCAALVALAWLSTMVLSVPIHGALGTASETERAALVARLVATNWPRTLAWTLRGALLLLAVARHLRGATARICRCGSAGKTPQRGSMTTPDLFQDKAVDWDTRPVPAQISEGVVGAIRARVPLSPGLTLMDFGAGTGLLGSKLAPSIRHIHAVDVSAAMLEQLASKEELRGKVTIHCQDILTAPLGLQVDLAVSAMAMHHVADTAGLLRALHDHLRPGGRVALADLDAEDGTFHPPGTEGVFHAGFDRGALGQKLSEAGFTDIEFGTATEVHKDGRGWPVFLVTARRD